MDILKNKDKPPIGITPKEIWLLKRKISLYEAIERYLHAGINIPVKWVEEYNSIEIKGDNIYKRKDD